MAWTTGSIILPEDAQRWDNKAENKVATQQSNGLISASNQTKLDGIESGAQKNPAVATTTTNGLLSGTDKTKLNGIATGATKNASDAQLRDRSTHTGTQSPDTIVQNESNRFVTDVEKTSWNGKAENRVAIQGRDGLLSGGDKTKLDSIETGAQKNPGNATSTSTGLMTSTDKSKLDGISIGADKTPGLATTSSNGIMSSTDKSKLDGIQTGATRVLVTSDITSLNETEVLSAASLKYYMRAQGVTAIGSGAVADIPSSKADSRGLVSRVEVDVPSQSEVINRVMNRIPGDYYLNPTINVKLSDVVTDLSVAITPAMTAFPAELYISRFRIDQTETSGVFAVNFWLTGGYNVSFIYRGNAAKTQITLLLVSGKSHLYTNSVTYNVDSFLASLKFISGTVGVGWKWPINFVFEDAYNQFTYEIISGSNSGAFLQRKVSWDYSVRQTRKYSTVNQTWGPWIDGI